MEQGPIRLEYTVETCQDGELPGCYRVQHDRVDEQIGARQEQEAKDPACIVEVGLPWMDFRPG